MACRVRVQLISPLSRVTLNRDCGKTYHLRPFSECVRFKAGKRVCFHRLSFATLKQFSVRSVLVADRIALKC